MKWLIIQQTVQQLTDNQDVNNLIFVIYKRYSIYCLLSQFLKYHFYHYAQITMLNIKQCMKKQYSVHCWYDNCIRPNTGRKGIIFITSNTVYYPGLCYKCLNLI